MNCLLFSREEVQTQSVENKDNNDVWNSISVVAEEDAFPKEEEDALPKEKDVPSKKRLHNENNNVKKTILMKKLKKNRATKKSLHGNSK